MVIDYIEEGKVKISITDYIKSIVNESPEEMKGVANTLAANHLFEINDNPILLDPIKAKTFHNIVAKLLFACKRARLDISTGVAFLCTRVQMSDEDDWKKLERMIRYLRNTSELYLTLEGDEARILNWWVDGSYATHADTKSHTGGTFTMGKGSVFSTSTKQKLNTRSSTETELVALHDVLPQIIWMNYFLNYQGYDLSRTQVYQDNNSAMLIENNGKLSSRKKMKRISVRYFFVHDRIKNGELKVKKCNTKDMVGDYFTKPLKGIHFKKFQDLILNIKSDS